MAPSEPAHRLVIGVDDPTAADVLALIEAHLVFSRTFTLPVDVHTLAADGPAAEDITLFTGRLDGRVVAMGALRRLDERHVEIKSMHTAAEARGRGFGRVMLDHLVTTARGWGCDRISLETGAMEAMAPARAMYGAAGFVPCVPFADYWVSVNSVCMTLHL